MCVYGGGGVLGGGGEGFKGEVSLGEGGERINEVSMTAMDVNSCMNWWRKVDMEEE